MQARIAAGFDPKKHGYTELAEWNTKLEVLCTELEQTEEKWLELAERAWDQCVVCTVPATLVTGVKLPGAARYLDRTL